MKDDIKKKFLDILFETEDEDGEVVVNQPMEDVKLTEEKPVVLKAHDILYNKNQSTTFFTVDKKPEIKTEEKHQSKDKYEIKPNLSPMFGVVNGKGIEETEVKEERKPVNMSAPIKKSHDSYLGTIISPIYGYDVKNDLSNTMNLSIHKVEDEVEIEEEPIVEEPSYYNEENDILADIENAFSDDIVVEPMAKEEEYVEEDFQEYEPEINEEPEIIDEPEIEDYVSDPIFKEVLSEEKGYTNTEEIDLFEDLFKEDN